MGRSMISRLMVHRCVLGWSVVCWNSGMVSWHHCVSFTVMLLNREMLVMLGWYRCVVDWACCLRFFALLRLFLSRLDFLSHFGWFHCWRILFLFSKDFKISSWIEWKIVRGVMAHVGVLISVDVVRLVVARIVMCAMLEHRGRIRVVLTQVLLYGKWRRHIVVVDLRLVHEMLVLVLGLNMWETRLEWLVMTVCLRAMMGKVGEISA